MGVDAGENSLGRCMFERCLEQGNSYLVGHGVAERLGDPVEEAHAKRRHTLPEWLIWRQGWWSHSKMESQISNQ